MPEQKVKPVKIISKLSASISARDREGLAHAIIDFILSFYPDEGEKDNWYKELKCCLTVSPYLPKDHQDHEYSRNGIDGLIQVMNNKAQYVFRFGTCSASQRLYFSGERREILYIAGPE